MPKNVTHHMTFPDHTQSFWQLGAIQAASFGLPDLVIGQQIVKNYDVGSALFAIIVGNLILWIIGLAIVAMSIRDKKKWHAIENAVEYLGKPAGVIAAIVLLLAILAWYSLQLQSSAVAVKALIPNIDWLSIGTIAVVFGLVISVMAYGGIRLIKKVCVFSVPFLVLFCLYATFISDHSVALNGPWRLSLPAVSIVILINLPGMINLPTFFRHSRSRVDSFFALTIMTVFMMFFQATSIWIGIDNPKMIADVSCTGLACIFYYIFAFIFLLLATTCINLVNIYFVSASLETLMKAHTNPRNYVAVGLIGTLVYLGAHYGAPVLFLENLVDNFIACLGIILLLALLTRIVVHHRPRTLDKLVSNSCWAIGCVSALITLIQTPNDPSHAFMIGSGMSVLSFIVAIFVEETIWASRNLPKTSR
ncbi:MAG: hypothetical protein KDK50_04010 [Chlamydiia bacterium]|nr:hypothetical protein [Chlamydiia bacterium]